MYACNLFPVKVYRRNSSTQIADTFFRFPDGRQVEQTLAMSQHSMGKFCIVEERPGNPSINVDGAVFEFPTRSGHLFIDFGDFCKQCKLLPPHNNGSEWFHKQRDSWERVAVRFGLERSAILQSQAYGELDPAHPGRCLLFPAISARFLLLFSLRSSRAATANHGLLHVPTTRDALSRVYQGLCSHLPGVWFMTLYLDSCCDVVILFALAPRPVALPSCVLFRSWVTDFAMPDSNSPRGLWGSFEQLRAILVHAIAISPRFLGQAFRILLREFKTYQMVAWASGIGNSGLAGLKCLPVWRWGACV